MVTGSLVVVVLLVAALAEGYRRSRQRITRLEKSLLVDPSTLTGTPFALEREFGHMVNAAQPFSYAELRLVDAGRAKEALFVLRSVCAHGVDLLFCTDLARGCFTLLTYGTLDANRVAGYFRDELQASGAEAKIGWAYSRSPDPKVRMKVRAAAQSALARASSGSGVEVALVDLEEWPAEDPNQTLMSDLRARRQSLCLTRKELASLAGIDYVALRDLEVGRAASARIAKHLATVLDTVQSAVSRTAALQAAVDSRPSVADISAPSLPPAVEREGSKVAPNQGTRGSEADDAPGE